MERDPGSVVDRCAIAQLKYERGVDQGSSLTAFAEGMSGLRKTFTNVPWIILSDISYGLNKLIWAEEAKIRQGQLDDDMEAAGKAAIRVREVNSIMVSLGNLINTLTGCGVIERKIDHASEGKK